jgi:hypothetical protein
VSAALDLSDLEPDFEKQKRMVDALPIERLIEAIARRGARALALAEAAFHELSVRQPTGEQRKDLVNRCADSARICRGVAAAVHALAPFSPVDREADNYAHTAASFDRLAMLAAAGKHGEERLPHG